MCVHRKSARTDSGGIGKVGSRETYSIFFIPFFSCWVLVATNIVGFYNQQKAKIKFHFEKHPDEVGGGVPLYESAFSLHFS
jgi:hypothetical protein